ncbi:MAG: glutathione S-transferase N-terminal domain-containing protein [Rhodovibrionaceae bacterium]|nr:glutathione S-transferase N-terminal domain-containing protein [Rhodovibrionaceae bacterium]
MKLLIATPSPFARKVRVALHEKSLPFEEVVDTPWNPDSAAPDHNPLGKIPVLLTDDGQSLYDSSVILEYLDTLEAEPKLIPAEPQARIRARQIEALADGICDAVVLIVLEQSRKEGLRSRDWMTRQRRKVEHGVAALAGFLDSNTWFVGAGMSVADVAAGACLGYLDLRLPDFEWRGPYPQLAAFSERMEARESFKLCRPSAQTIAPVG